MAANTHVAFIAVSILKIQVVPPPFIFKCQWVPFHHHGSNLKGGWVVVVLFDAIELYAPDLQHVV